MLRRPPEQESVLAWFVGEGDQLVGGATIVSVSREAVTRQVRIVTDRPQVATVAHDHPVIVVRRAR